MAKIKNKLAYLLALVIPTFGFAQDTEPKSAGSEEAASESASGS